MRTAITLTKSHSGKWALAAGPDESLLEQRKQFRELRAAKTHADFSEVHYQESDGHREVIRLLTPKAHEAQEKQRKADLDAVKKFDEEAAKKAANNPAREKSEKEFKANAAKAAAEEEAAKKAK